MSHHGLSSVPDWETTQVSELVSSQDLIQMDTNGSAEEACMDLIKHSISSIPLYDQKSKSYLGLFDLNDLVKHINLCTAKSGANTPTGSGADISSFYSQQRLREFSISSKLYSRTERLDRLVFAENIKEASENSDFAFLNKNVMKLSDISTFDPFYAVLPETTLSQVVEVFASRLHRVAVMCDSGSISGILSQSTVNKFLVHYLQHLGASGLPSAFNSPSDNDTDTESHRHVNSFTDPKEKKYIASDLRTSQSWNQLNDFVSKSLIEHKLGGKSIWAVLTTTPVTSALYLFEKHQFSSLLVIGSENDVVGSISTSDIKYLVMPEFRYLINESCFELLQKVRQYQGIVNGRDSAAIFSVNSNSSLKSVMVKIAVTGSHRIWVTTNNLQPSTSPSSRSTNQLSSTHPSSIPPRSTALNNNSTSSNSTPSTNLPTPSAIGMNLLDANGATLRLPPPALGESCIVGVVSLTDVFTVISSLILANTRDFVDYAGMN